MTVQSNYRVFSTSEMLIRTKRVTEILDLGGHVRGAAYKSHALLARIPVREVDELTELCDVFRDSTLRMNNAQWKITMLEELADVVALAELGLRAHTPPETSALAPNPSALRKKWQGYVKPTKPFDHSLELAKGQVQGIAQMLTETKQGIQQWMTRGDMGFTPEQLTAALQAKRLKAGDFEGLAISKVILTEDCPLVATFEKHPRWKADVLAPEDIQNSLNHDMIHAVTSKG